MIPDTRSAWIWLPPVLSLALLATLAASVANRSLFVLLNHSGHPLGMLLMLPRIGQARGGLDGQ